MKRLSELVKIVENNKECVVLEVAGERIDLIKLGCFNGDEEMFRLTKGKNHTCTVWTKDGKHYSWYWGIDGYTCVSKEMDKRGKLIEECITNDFEIYIGENKDKINSTLYIMSLEDVKHTNHIVKLMYWDKHIDDDVCCHLDGEYFKRFRGIHNALEYFKDHGYSIESISAYTARTGCKIEEYLIKR